MFDLPPPPPVAAIELRLPDAASNFNPAQPLHLAASLQESLHASLKPSLAAPRMSNIRLAANETATNGMNRLTAASVTGGEKDQPQARVQVDISALRKGIVWSRPDQSFRVAGYVKISPWGTLRITDNWPGFGEMIAKDKDGNGYVFVDFLATPSGSGYTHAFYFTDRSTNDTESLVIPFAPPAPPWAATMARDLNKHAARIRNNWRRMFGADQTVTGAQVQAAARRATGANKASLEALLQHTSEGHSVFGVMAGQDLILTPRELNDFIKYTSRNVSRGKYGYIVSPTKNWALWRLAFVKDRLLYDALQGKAAKTYDSRKIVTTGALNLATYLMSTQLHSNPKAPDAAKVMDIIQRLTDMPNIGPGVTKAASWVGVSFGHDNRRKLQQRLLTFDEILLRMPTLDNLGGGVEGRLLDLLRRGTHRDQLWTHIPDVIRGVHERHEEIANLLTEFIVMTDGVIDVQGGRYRDNDHMINIQIREILDYTITDHRAVMAARAGLEVMLRNIMNVPRDRAREILDAIMLTVYGTNDETISFQTRADQNYLAWTFLRRNPEPIPNDIAVGLQPNGTMTLLWPYADFSRLRAGDADLL